LDNCHKQIIQSLVFDSKPGETNKPIFLLNTILPSGLSQNKQKKKKNNKKNKNKKTTTAVRCTICATPPTPADRLQPAPSSTPLDCEALHGDAYCEERGRLVL